MARLIVVKDCRNCPINVGRSKLCCGQEDRSMFLHELEENGFPSWCPLPEQGKEKANG